MSSLSEYDRYIREERSARGEVQPVQRGHPDPERASRQEVRALPLQLSPHLQEQFPENSLPQAKLQAYNQPGA